MRKLAFALALLFMINIAFAATLPSILVSKVDPQPVEPGKDLTIDVTLFNRLTGDSGEFSVTLNPTHPIIFKSASEDLSRVALCGGCKKDFKYFLSIDPSASSGIYPIYVKAFSGGSEVKQKVDIKVQGKPNLAFSTSTEGLNNITPNQQFTIVLDVTNIGSGQARQIKIQPDSTNFVVLGGSLITIDTLNTSETKQAVFDFVASSSLEANSYSIPFRFTYLDEQGNTINTSQNLGLRVVNKGDINIQTIKIAATATGSSIITAGQPFTVVVRLGNVGQGDADFITAEIKCPFNGPKKAFLGQLKKDEDAPAVFDLISNNAGTFTCDLNVLYKDDIGTHEFSDKFNVVVSPGSSPIGIILAIVVIVVLYFFRKRILAPFAKKEKGIA